MRRANGLRPALIAAVAPSILRAPRRGLEFSIGGSLYLVSIALLAAATVGVFFGIAFFLVRQSADAMVSVHPVGARVSDAATPPHRDLPRGAAAALGASNVTTAMARTAVPAHSDIAPAPPGPAQKALASEPTKAGAQHPAALRLPDRQLAELLARGDEFLAPATSPRRAYFTNGRLMPVTGRQRCGWVRHSIRLFSPAPVCATCVAIGQRRVCGTIGPSDSARAKPNFVLNNPETK